LTAHAAPFELDIGFLAFTQEGLVNAQGAKFIRDHRHSYAGTLSIVQEMTHQRRLPSAEET